MIPEILNNHKDWHIADMGLGIMDPDRRKQWEEVVLLKGFGITVSSQIRSDCLILVRILRIQHFACAEVKAPYTEKH